MTGGGARAVHLRIGVRQRPKWPRHMHEKFGSMRGFAVLVPFQLLAESQNRGTDDEAAPECDDRCSLGDYDSSGRVGGAALDRRSQR